MQSLLQVDGVAVEMGCRDRMHSKLIALLACIVGHDGTLRLGTKLQLYLYRLGVLSKLCLIAAQIDTSAL